MCLNQIVNTVLWRRFSKTLVRTISLQNKNISVLAENQVFSTISWSAKRLQKFIIEIYHSF